MNLYPFPEAEFASLESLRVPLAVYQFIDRRVITRILSAGFRDLFEFDSREGAYSVMSRDMYSTCHPDDAARVANAAFRFATEGGVFESVYRLKSRKSGVYKLIHARGEHVYKPTGERLAFVWYTDEGSYTGDNGPQQEALKASFRAALHVEGMIQASYYDDLTSLPNMSYFLELVEAGRSAIQEAGHTPALLFLDLNGMKHFNRKYGFAEGNKLIRAVAKVLSARFTSDNCSRFGQDHFAVLTYADGLEERLEELLQACAEVNNGQNLPVRIGVYVEGDQSVPASMACDRAKYACDSLQNIYASGYRFFHLDMLTEMEKRQYILENLDRAIAEGWIRVCYQPIIRSANGRVCDEEALSRWIDPVRGLLSPADFIPVLEDAGLIYKLDLYVVDCILEKLKAQAAAGLYIVPQSVNLSRSDFDVCDIVEEIRRRVDEAGVERSKLTIEITESVVGSDFEFIQTQIQRFQALGFSVWMDDFGSGYSSLDVLQSTHFDLIKFDMRFMHRFSEGEETRIILSELIRMCIGLGIDTVCEGVETREQVSFLREVGCTKLQGFYFCRPIPPEEIVERNRKGIQIGYENPQESSYYGVLGRINLYDASALAQDSKESMQNYFNTIPMAIYESTSDDFLLMRCNNSYRTLFGRFPSSIQMGVRVPYCYTGERDTSDLYFLRMLRQCGIDGKRQIFDDLLPDGSTSHVYMKRVAVNPVTGTSALAVAVLAVTEKQADGPNVSYAQIASALSSDYFDLFYVNLETEAYVQYSSNKLYQDLSTERNGQDFFNASRQNALSLLDKRDQAAFIRMFTKENVVHALDTQGSFTLTYRLMMDGAPIYVNMKAVRMENDPTHIIIGVNNVNAQMKERLALEQLEEERITFARISALAGNYICIYTVDPETDHYTEYISTPEYAAFDIEKSGEDFFTVARENGQGVVYPEDLELYLTMFTGEGVKREIARSGVYELRYRLMIDCAPKYVSLKAVMVQEKSGPKILIGVNNIDSRVRRELEYMQAMNRLDPRK